MQAAGEIANRSRTQSRLWGRGSRVAIRLCFPPPTSLLPQLYLPRDGFSRTSRRDGELVSSVPLLLSHKTLGVA